MLTTDALEAAKAGFRLRRRGWPADKYMVYDFEPGQGFTIRDQMGWQTDIDPDNAPMYYDWETTK